MPEHSLPLIPQVYLTGAAEQISIPLYLVTPAPVQKIRHVSYAPAAFLQAQGFEGKEGDFILVPDESGKMINGIKAAVYCVSSHENPETFGILAQKLPAGLWHGVNETRHKNLEEALALGFGMGAYHYSLRHDAPEAVRQQKKVDQGYADRKYEAASPVLVVSDPVFQKIMPLVQAIWLGRDLINIPANLLGPETLAKKAKKALKSRGAMVEIITGKALEEAYPCLAAVGAGSDRPPAVLVARWNGGENTRRLSLVGKGVCFDTGGYDLKPGASMLKMKKDMGGAALMLAFACALIDRKASVSFELRLGCVENSISGHAMRPGDVLQTRKGLRVELGNTDAEGRLVLCDLLAEAAESKPDILIDAATLTGAARIALGPDIPALFCNDDRLAETLLRAGRQTYDPLWRLPLWNDYNAWLDSAIADCNNVSSRPMAGAITAALYLQRFVPDGQKWLHIDTYAWNDKTRPGRPEGGETLALRALLAAFG